MTEKTTTPRTRSRKAKTDAAPKAVNVAAVVQDDDDDVVPAEPTQRYATLRRGRVYYLGETVFERGVPKPVTPEQEKWLTENARDEVTVKGEYDNERESRQKFDFSDSPEPSAAQGSPPARQRR